MLRLKKTSYQRLNLAKNLNNYRKCNCPGFKENARVQNNHGRIRSLSVDQINGWDFKVTK